MSDGTRSAPASGTVQEYTNFAQFFYRKIYEKMNSISSNFHYAPTVSYITQQINEGKKVVVFAHSAGNDLAEFLKNQVDSTKRASISIIGLGPGRVRPTNYMLNGLDVVNQYIIPHLSSSIPATFSVSSSSYILQHEGLSYLSQGSTVTQMIVSAKNAATTPNRLYGSGPITV